MRIFSRTPWYVDGLAFECLRCGRCCAGPEEGYVWAEPEEVAAVAEYLQLAVDQLHDRYLRRIGRRVSFLEHPATKDCVFLSYDSDGLSRCRVYPVRPIQCGTWPFWASNLKTPGDWSAAQIRCPGINRGPRHSFHDIERKRKRTKA
ncbi:MAG TPA: YkgJ family cysteine cluster protein [Phycisphaerae bacterium]|nr:YkgJ family cysteine cluster protein [Phycisphaerae bacterium]HUU23028.1 YkgJ family cysteine cluster protein [Phycisphaerae bacterium]